MICIRSTTRWCCCLSMHSAGASSSSTTSARHFCGGRSSEGLVSKLTSQFPSTTAAHVTTIHTGLPVGESGVYEWYYYEPLLDRMIAPLLFSFAGDTDATRWRRPASQRAALYPLATLYQELQPHGVDSFVFQHHSYAHSPYSKVVTNGARIVPYRTLPEALVNLGQLLDRQKRKAYYFLYIDIDRHDLPSLRPRIAAHGGRDRGFSGDHGADLPQKPGRKQSGAHCSCSPPIMGRSRSTRRRRSISTSACRKFAIPRNQSGRAAAGAGRVEPRYVFAYQG